ncbi:DEKNAAC100917 [Brettanomyces naardenensis]|uniref:Arginase n=1 Tax=Brettanomyces naardenensis TaxID=13370 RepID=A0A448YGU7_BRENA|nr:DEKNAAC100917 [Brettanomyces naardenensis]
MTIQSQYKFFPERKVTVIRAPFNGGQGKLGVELGPDRLVEYGLLSDIKELGWKYEISDPLKGTDWEEMRHDSSDMFDNCKRPHMVSECCKKIYQASSEARRTKSFPLTIGGDHSIGMSTILAFINAHPDGGIIWVDAHADINTPSSTDSGNLHGCPVAFAMGLDEEHWPSDFEWIKQLKHLVKPNQIAYIGLRDVDKGEKKILKDLGIAAFSMYHIDKYGINGVVKRAIKAINPTGEGPIHVSYDVDGIDPQYVAATGTPVRGGLTLREGLFIVEELAATGLLAGLDIVEVNPSLGASEMHMVDTVNAGLSISRCALGETIL